MTEMTKPTPEVSEATEALIRAAAKFAGAAAGQFSKAKPDDYAQLCKAFESGLAEMVVVVALNPGNHAVQLCADIGAKRQVMLTVPASDHGAKH